MKLNNIEINYRKETEKMLEIICREDWMTDDDWQEFISVYSNYKLINPTAPSIDELAEALKKGVQNGYSVEKQIEIAKLIHNK
ncbi:hypothetical protein J2X97_000323 [Epilithonimonas hungarica]|uniref:hypothetical protein n=1 Tax=Epilithonimonas hungarica TaxID=454006 RepID=UPI002785B9F6|nr:hypothetical protein [Epilithonimonas hungarica]MDP9954686.1 hypothetical protein [Epilithonimonas hungarica]